MGSKIQKSWNFEISVLKIMSSGFYYSNLEQIDSRKLLNLLFNNIFHKNLPNFCPPPARPTINGHHQLGCNMPNRTELENDDWRTILKTERPDMCHVSQTPLPLQVLGGGKPLHLFGATLCAHRLAQKGV